MGLACGVTLIAGCYVVPIHPAGPQHPAATAHANATPASLTFTARLYPSNAEASVYGVVGAVVTQDLNGRGVFSATINGELFSGEATRTTGTSARQGIANGSGNRGSYINCGYQMNSATLGTGQCSMSNGAQFTMHVGS